MNSINRRRFLRGIAWLLMLSILPLWCAGYFTLLRVQFRHSIPWHKGWCLQLANGDLRLQSPKGADFSFEGSELSVFMSAPRYGRASRDVREFQFTDVQFWVVIPTLSKLIDPTFHNWDRAGFRLPQFERRTPIKGCALEPDPPQYTLATIPLGWPAFAILVIGTCALRRYRRFPAGHCQSCGYNLTNNTSGTCPECGTASSPASVKSTAAAQNP